MKYYSELQSSDVLRRVVRRLPRWLTYKWAERSFHIRTQREPTLVDLEIWLQSRIMISKDPYVHSFNDNKHSGTNDEKLTTYHTRSEDKKHNDNKCSLCNDSYWFHKCEI